ncbi:MGDG synthase family glycosyltransferase [Actinopolymorpha rutila]|uniref:UDP-N-acetylglucosamine:LPS N-acetylglucosamine transferase n=1 Tax=Actinopolymorpha rutila TaxID=446787 RepID=A0A852ZGU4_9ACTN|nr:galactosyldiacylglycerol synthase [Actinopolymorpha rutila]NYH92307.1 UDP-N-acetylglucosamine:LPS N-acetylglucosamine transferase [Actinopolymorpha rutila]
MSDPSVRPVVPNGRRTLIVSASMGGGHDQVAAETARRLRERGHQVQLLDLLRLLPAGIGGAIRSGYAATLRYGPGRYQRVYDRFADPDAARQLVEPLVRLLVPAARDAVRAADPDTVVTTFHLAAAVVGRLRMDGVLRTPALVVLTEFAPHALWLSPGNDAYLCLSPEGRDLAAGQVGARAYWLGPLTPQSPGNFPNKPADGGDETYSADGRHLVVLSTGAWGVATNLVATVRALVESGRYFPLVLCGRNERLLARLDRVAGPGHALGWRDDVDELLAGAYALVENSGGQTCTEAFGAGTPVVIHQPLPGHGLAAAAHLTRIGAVTRTDDPRDLPAALDSLGPGTPARSRQVECARALFRPDSTDLLECLTQVTT